jgi:hypothetical protein
MFPLKKKKKEKEEKLKRGGHPKKTQNQQNPWNPLLRSPLHMFYRLRSRRSQGQTRSQKKQRLIIVEKLSQ